MHTEQHMPCGRKVFCGNYSCKHSIRCAEISPNNSKNCSPAAKIVDCDAKNERETKYASLQNVVYLYDGSYMGFFCCVFESVYSHTLPCDIFKEDEAAPTLFTTVSIATNSEKAQRVIASIPKKICESALELVQTVFLSCLENKELALLKFLLLGYEKGPRIMNMLGHTDVAVILNAEKHLGGEAHLLRGFIRFSDYNGFLAATITPKNFVLPFLEKHFVMRYSNENFMIFDKTHKAALIYENKTSRIVQLDGIEFPAADENELKYRDLWKNFYNTISIEARENPKCRMTHMPKRYWENMLEVCDLV
jgi:probable DNA metabolism protein